MFYLRFQGDVKLEVAISWQRIILHGMAVSLNCNERRNKYSTMAEYLKVGIIIYGDHINQSDFFHIVYSVK